MEIDIPSSDSDSFQQKSTPSRRSMINFMNDAEEFFHAPSPAYIQDSKEIASNIFQQP